MSLQLQYFLRAGGTLEYLKETLGITATPSKKFPNLYQFKYSQIESPEAHPLVVESRGLILDSTDNWNVVAHPFHRFFNYGSGHCPEIDWETARCQEKLDGSLIILYHYRDEWHVATSGSPDAAGNVNDFDMTFAELFWKVFNDTRERENALARDLMKTDEFSSAFVVDWFRPENTYMWELTTPYNRVVVPHKESRITLIGIRNRVTGKELPVSCVPFLNPVKEFPLQSFEQVAETFSSMDPIEQEGYVIVDGNFNRVKVKHPGYVALHHMKDSVGSSRKNMLEVVRSGESTEFLTYFPEWTEVFNDIQARYNQLVEPLDDQYTLIRIEAENGGRKRFAELAKTTKLPSYFFTRLDGKTENARQFVAGMQIDHLMRALGLKE